MFLSTAATYSWSLISQIAGNEFHDRRVQADILVALGLGDLGFIDYDLTELLTSISYESTIESVQELLIPVLIEEIVAAVESGSATTGLKFEKLFTQHEEILSLSEKIVDLRNAEISKVPDPIAIA